MRRAKQDYQKLKHRLVKITLEPDYADEAWEQDAAPTPASHPEAFYQHAVLAYPQQKAAAKRRKPHDHLSRRNLRNRLYQAGLRGAEAKRVFAEILAGPSSIQDSVGRVAMSWNVNAFKRRFGKRVSRAVLRFVRISFIIADEAWSLLNSPTTASFLDRVMSTARKYGTAIVHVDQQVGMPALETVPETHLTFTA